MKYLKIYGIALLTLFASVQTRAQVADSSQYLQKLKQELQTEWPKSRTINVVFHGHSVPAGYWENHEVHTLESYPNLFLKALKAKYPYAVVNVIVTAIGGENAISGQARFEKDVLPHRPDILFIDYALNDRFSPLDKVKSSWAQMIETAQAKGIPVILLTPSPDQRINIADPANPLDPYVVQIRDLAKQYKTGLADPYVVFQQLVKDGKLKEVMASVNHPNETGHMVIVNRILPYF